MIRRLLVCLAVFLISVLMASPLAWAEGMSKYGDDVSTHLSDVWYLAEGSTDWGFDCWIAIINPNDKDVLVTTTYMKTDGSRLEMTMTLVAESQSYIDTSEQVGRCDFSTKIETEGGEPIAVDRTMMWMSDDMTSLGMHCSIGVTEPSTTWYLPEGSSDWGFETWLLIQNPNDTEATAHVTYMIEDAEAVTFEKKIPAYSRKTYNIAKNIGKADASIKVQADIPIIPERAMYRNNRSEGHDSIGTTSPSSDYYMAEGTTDWGFQTYILVQNPNPSATEVDVTYMTPTGPVPNPSFTMPANSRKTIDVNAIYPNMDFSTHVHGSQPIIAERSMYWSSQAGFGTGCHDSIGLSESHENFYFADGSTSADPEVNIETWTLVQNPNSFDVDIKLSYLTPAGEANYELIATVPANSRKTYFMANIIPEGTASIMVESLTENGKIMAERAIYACDRTCGSDTIGANADPSLLP